MFNLSIEIGWLVAHPYVAYSECSNLEVEYFIDSLDNKTLQCHLFNAGTPMVVGTVRVI